MDTQIPATRIVAAGALVALLDGLFAVVYFDFVLKLATVTQIFQGIAHALIGPAAYTGGLATAFLGLGLHVTVAMSWAAAYWLALRFLPSLRQHVGALSTAVPAGVVLGAIVWLAMDLLILPLTYAVPRPSMSSTFFVTELIGHMIIVGPPIALTVRPVTHPRHATIALAR